MSKLRPPVLSHHVVRDPKLSSDTTADDSDKSVTVPTDYQWAIFAIRAKLATTATVGNRQLVLQVRDDSDVVLAEFPAGATQAASLTYHYMFCQGVPYDSSVRAEGSDDGVLFAPFSGWILQPGWDIRVFDSAGVDAAADDLEVHVTYDELYIGDAL